MLLLQKKHDLWRQNERDEARRLQSSGNSRKDKEMTLEPPRRRPEWPDWEEARGGEEDAWRLEPEWETKVPETFIVADVVEGTYVDSNGKFHQGRGKEQKYRSRRGVPGGEEIKSPKRKVFRVESEETQDFVREAKSTDQEEVEELSFVPSAISVLQKMTIINVAKKNSRLLAVGVRGD